MREVAGVSGMGLASELGWSQSKVSRIEGGLLGVSLSDLAAVLAALGASEEVTAELLTMSATADGKEGAWVVQAGGPVRRQGEVAAVESRVTRIRQYSALTVPGLLQAPGYTHAMAQAGRYGDPSELVEARGIRQALLTRPDAPRYDVVLDRRALQRWPGSSETLREQLQRLVAACDLDQVNLRVLPNGPVAVGAIGLAQFLLYDFKEPVGRSVVMLESQTADTYLSSNSDIAVYSKLFEDLEASAMGIAESGEYLEELLRDAAA